MTNMTGARVLPWALLLAMPLWFGSCRKEADSAVTPSLLEGTWRIAGLRSEPGADLLYTGEEITDLIAYLDTLSDGSGTDIITCLTSTTVTFNSNKRVIIKEAPTCTLYAYDLIGIAENSTWKLEGNKLTLSSNLQSRVYDVARTDSTLTLVRSAEEDYGNGPKTYTTTIKMKK
ncbi:lipocalin family protein [Spirosoma sordidisoli]|uniref:Lipocalin-like domain-containing protein n=1 Tax=Spirosoma sordidisoli TaxID=2502893 RepID=A0A4Q2UF54_9BACT|nr:lipocalin family protein [Spirosoma sordidisoli]RYC67913.1 hypothetical protein EQG79_20850 [Spirosoma sordidisoli]